MRIAVDAMGGDFGPEVVVPGAVEAAREGIPITLVGQEAAIQRELDAFPASIGDIVIVHAPDEIGMDEHAAQAVRRKPNASIPVALREVKEGRAAAMISAGHSGAVMAAALLVLGRINGIDRPALATALPHLTGRSLLLDVGAVTDPRPSHMMDFARMGSIYAERVFAISHPTVGLLSNGEEAGKGNQLVLEVHQLLKAASDINFYGNVEGNRVLEGVVDVVVTDGFSGNVALKMAEGASSLFSALIREELTKTLPRKLAALALRPAFDSLRSRVDYREYGGAPLLGVNGTVAVAHGRSDVTAITNAIRMAYRVASENVVDAIAASTSSQRVVQAESSLSELVGIHE
jgi:glycerol-3-phosphate acyltransferase PlsX